MGISKIKVDKTEISVILENSGEDYICLTDMARYKDNDPALVISHWMRNLNTIEYLGVWEILHNPDFKPTEFGRFKSEADLLNLAIRLYSERLGRCEPRLRTERNEYTGCCHDKPIGCYGEFGINECRTYKAQCRTCRKIDYPEENGSGTISIA